MTTLELLFSVSVIFWAAIFLYLMWLHSKIRKISSAMERLRKH